MGADPRVRPLLSICIPQHNRTEFLLQALDSLAEQRFDDFEVCIADDYSDDGKQHLIDEYIAHSRLRIKKNSNRRNLRYDLSLRPHS